jgi:hypothetical protein
LPLHVLNFRTAIAIHQWRMDGWFLDRLFGRRCRTAIA